METAGGRDRLFGAGDLDLAATKIITTKVEISTEESDIVKSGSKNRIETANCLHN